MTDSTPIIEHKNPKALYDPSVNAYCHVVTVKNQSALAYIAGQGGDDLAGHLPETFEGQVAQAFKNIQAALDEVNATPQQILKLGTYIVNHNEDTHAVLTKHLIDMFGETFPAQTLVPVPRLALDGMLFEIDAIVAL